jgi:hypothetical protein
MDPLRQQWLEYALQTISALDLVAPPKPSRTIRIHPAEVVSLAGIHVATKAEHGSKWYDFGRIVDGDWDLAPKPRNRPLQESAIHLSAFKRYVEGVPWGETPIFADRLQAIAKHGTVDYCTSREELVERYQRLDDVFGKVQNERELKLEEEVGGSFVDNISVSITRTGGFLLATGGAHRLAIAQLLRLPSIEVYVLARHALWQRIRVRASQQELAYRHPDLDEFYAERERDPAPHPDRQKTR